MKKIITTALALVLSLGMSVTAFAAVSPNAGVSGGATTLADGTRFEADIKALDAQTTAVATDKAKELVGADSQVLKAVEVSLPTAISVSNPATVEFEIPNIAAGTALFALHQKADGTWEKLDCTWKDGKVYVTFTSLSPVVFVTASTAAGNNNNNNSDTSTATTPTSAQTASPKTADDGVNTLVFVVLACGAAIICVNRKKAA